MNLEFLQEAKIEFYEAATCRSQAAAHLSVGQMRIARFIKTG